MNVCTQLSLADVYKNFQDLMVSDKPAFFSLLEEHLDFSDFIPVNFYNAYYQKYGRNRVYPLSGFIASLIFQKVASVPTDSMLILLLNICKELRDFCGFKKFLMPLNSLILNRISNRFLSKYFIT